MPHRNPSRLRLAGVAAAVMVTATLAACTGTGSSDPTGAASQSAPAPTGLADGETGPHGTVAEVASNLDAPWSVIRVNGATLISERDSARVLELRAGGRTRTVGTISGVQHGGEAGLLGLAVHGGDLYVYSTADSGNRVQRYPLHGEPGSLRLGPVSTVIDGLPSNSFHDGGRIAFGPDGMLYITTGDAGRSEEAQDRASLAGKILRITPDGEVPPGNPFPGSPVWTLGHRNVQGLGWAADGTMFASEFGENDRDELNVIRPGANYGWPEVEGDGGTDRGFVDPVQQWPVAEASPSGLTIIDDTIFIANLRGEVVRGIPVSDPSRAHEYFRSQFGRIRTVLPGPDGSLWFVTNNTDGRGTPGGSDDRILQVPLTQG